MTNDMCLTVRALAAEAALDLLDGPEREAVLRHHDHCVACRTDVAELATTADQLLELAPVDEPRPDLEGRVVASILAEAQGVARLDQARSRPGTRSDATRRVRRARVLLLAAAVAVAALAGGLVGAGLTRSGAGTEVASTAGVTTADVLDGGGDWAGEALVLDGRNPWVGMDLRYGVPDGTYDVAVVGADGTPVVVGSMVLTGGAGTWAGPVAGDQEVAEVQLVGADGAVVCRATFA